MPNLGQEQAQRRNMLRELLLHGPANTQQTLVNALRTKGLSATQSSVSRDLREIGAIKTGQGYELPGVADTVNEMVGVTEFLRDIRLSEHDKEALLTTGRSDPADSIQDVV